MWAKLLGTISAYFRIGFTGPRLKDSSGNLLIRNAGDSADAEVTASKVKISGEVLEINSDAAAAGADWNYTLQRPTSGMTAAVVLTLPVDDGTANQVLQTDGNGTLSWASAGSTAACRTVNSTTIAFNESSPATMFTRPANAVLHCVRVINDTPFDGTPMVTVGISGATSKYMGATDSDLTMAAKSRFEVYPAEQASGSTEALIATYSQGGATVGSARIEVEYSVPA